MAGAGDGNSSILLCKGNFFSQHINISIDLLGRNLFIYRKKQPRKKNLNHLESHIQHDFCQIKASALCLTLLFSRTKEFMVLSVCEAAHLGKHQSFQLLLQGPWEAGRR